MSYAAKPHVVLPDNLIRIPLTRQSMNWTCGVASVQSYLRYFGVDLEYREGSLVEELKAEERFGTKYYEIARFLREKGFVVDYHTGWTMEELKATISSGTPVLVCFQAWVEWDDPKVVDWESRWEDGHYAIIVGHSDENLFFMDPSSLGVYTYIPTEEFETRWHDYDLSDDNVSTRLVHWGLTAKKDTPNDTTLHLAHYLG